MIVHSIIAMSLIILVHKVLQSFLALPIIKVLRIFIVFTFIIEYSSLRDFL
jgi:hypothetical protein